MINKVYKDQTRDILKKKMGADELFKKVERGFKNFICSPFKEKHNQLSTK